MANAYAAFGVEKHGDTATLWLNTPEKRNAMGRAFWDELPKVMDDLAEDDSVRAIVLAGRGKDFTVGLDLKEMAGLLASGGGGG